MVRSRGRRRLISKPKTKMETREKVEKFFRLTSFLRASGAVHLTGSLTLSDTLESTFVRPKSLTLATLSSEIKMFRAARSLWTSFLDSRYSIPSHTSLPSQGGGKKKKKSFFGNTATGNTQSNVLSV